MVKEAHLFANSPYCEADKKSWRVGYAVIGWSYNSLLRVRQQWSNDHKKQFRRRMI
jgi:hypothetical protein